MCVVHLFQVGLHGAGREGIGVQLSYSDNYPPPLLRRYMSNYIHAGLKVKPPQNAQGDDESNSEKQGL